TDACNPPTAVTLRSFTATRIHHGVVLRWRTGTEAGLAGFDLYRRGHRVNQALIPARHRLGGSTYVYRDRLRGLARGYLLEAVKLDGSRVRLGRARLRGR